MSEPSVEEIVAAWEENAETALRLFRNGATVALSAAWALALIAGWRKKGEALDRIRIRISRDAGNRTFDHASELIDWIDDECRAALTPPQPHPSA